PTAGGAATSPRTVTTWSTGWCSAHCAGAPVERRAWSRAAGAPSAGRGSSGSRALTRLAPEIAVSLISEGFSGLGARAQGPIGSRVATCPDPPGDSIRVENQPGGGVAGGISSAAGLRHRGEVVEVLGVRSLHLGEEGRRELRRHVQPLGALERVLQDVVLGVL